MSDASGAFDLRRVPPPPRVPGPAAQALIFRFQPGAGILLLVGAILAASGIPFVALFCWGLPTDVMISLSGAVTEARVSSTEIDETTEVNGRNPTIIRFRYQVAGETFAGEGRTLDDELITRAHPDASVEVEYATDDPARARLRGETHAFFGWFGLLSLLFPGVGLAFVAYAVRSRRRAIRAFTFGRPVAADVFENGLVHSTRINGQHPYRLSWRFRIGNDEHTGSVSTMKPELLGDLVQAPRVIALVDPADPDVSTLWIA